jgi:hypothetical protein
VLVRFNHIASIIVNANHCAMCPAAKLRVVNCVAECVLLAIPQPTKWQRIGNQIDAAMVPARAGEDMAADAASALK